MIIPLLINLQNIRSCQIVLYEIWNKRVRRWYNTCGMYFLAEYRAEKSTGLAIYNRKWKTWDMDIKEMPGKDVIRNTCGLNGNKRVLNKWYSYKVMLSLENKKSL